jgi:hypothetical protein
MFLIRPGTLAEAQRLVRVGGEKFRFCLAAFLDLVGPPSSVARHADAPQRFGLGEDEAAPVRTLTTLRLTASVNCTSTTAPCFPIVFRILPMIDSEYAIARPMTFPGDGSQHFPCVLDAADLQGIRNALGDLPPAQAGVRVHGIAALRPFLTASGPVGVVASSVLGNACRPVRALLFDKTPGTNWSLGWHQDRTISVEQRIDVDGFGPWTIKNGLLHVEPSFDILLRMVTLRVHLDPVPAVNGPLLIAPGSHRFGRVAQADVPQIVQRCGTVACLADAGDIWLYATPILHASRPALEPGHRRVLQIDFAAEELPGGLTWLGV